MISENKFLFFNDINVFFFLYDIIKISYIFFFTKKCNGNDRLVIKLHGTNSFDICFVEGNIFSIT